MSTKTTKLLSGRAAVVPYANLDSSRYQFLSLEQAEPNLGAGANNSILTISTNNTRVWSNSITLSSIQFSDGTTQNTSPRAIGNTANAAFLQANTPSYVANSAASYANSAFAAANSSIATNITQNNSITASFNHANAAFAAANTINTSNVVIISANSSSAALRITQVGSGNALLVEDSANPDATPFVVDANGNVGIGTTSIVDSAKLTLSGKTYFNNYGNSSSLTFRRAQGSESSPTTSTIGNFLSDFSFQGYDGTNYLEGGYLRAEVDGNPTTNSMPTMLTFGTTANGSSTPIERMRIDSAGNIGIGISAPLGYSIRSSKNVTGANSTYGFVQEGTVQSDVTNFYNAIQSQLNTQASAFTLFSARLFLASQGNIGASSTITTQYGFIADATLVGATNNYAFFGNIPSGTNRWNFYANGTAANVFRGTTSLGGLVGAESLRATPVASAVNYVGVSGNIAGSGVSISSLGSDTDIDLVLTPKGTGSVTTSSPLVVSANSSSDALRITQVGTGNALLVEDSTNPDSTPFVIDNSGNVGIGTSTPLSKLHIQNLVGVSEAEIFNIVVQQTSGNSFFDYDYYGSNPFTSSFLRFRKARNTLASPTIVANNDVTGRIGGMAYDGVKFVDNALIRFSIDGVPALNDVPGRIEFYTTPAAAAALSLKMVLKEDGNLGIGTSSPTAKLEVLANTTNDAVRITQTGTGNALLVEDSANPDATPTVIDSTGKVVVGHTATVAMPTGDGGLYGAGLEVLGSGGVGSSLGAALYNNAAAGFGGALSLAKSNSATIGAHASVASGDLLGAIYFSGSDGTQFIRSAQILTQVDGTPDTNDMPGRLVFSTTADGASIPTERMRIRSDGNIGIGASGSVFSRVTVGSYATSGGYSAGYESNGTIPSGTTVSHVNFDSKAYTTAAVFNLSILKHFAASQPSAFGAGSTVTSQIGFEAVSTLTGATYNYGFYGNIASGSSRYNFYANGTAANVFRGTTSLGGLEGSESLRVTPVASAVNYWQFYGSATGGSIAMYATGSDANISAVYVAKNNGFHFFNAASGTQLAIAPVASAVNYLQVVGAAAGGAPGLQAQGTDTNISLKLTPKGTGRVDIIGDLDVTGNLTVTGLTTYTNTSTVLIADNIITVNAAISQSAQPAVNAGIEVDRGAQPNSSFLWIESSGKWAANNGNGSIFIAADSAESYANAAFLAANAATATDATQNNSITAAFNTANAAFTVANNAVTSANGTIIWNTANAAFVAANAANATDTTQNNSITAAFNTANAAFTVANNAVTSSNGTIIWNTANAAFVAANAANDTDTTQNNSISAAFTRANNSINANTGGTITGDLSVTGNTVISVNSANAALRITQVGTGNAILVEDSANPDATPFVVTADGKVGAGTTTPTASLEVVAANPSAVARASSNTGFSLVGSFADDYYSTPTYRGTFLGQYSSAATGTTLGFANASLGYIAFQNTTSNALIYTNGGTGIVFGTTSVDRGRVSSAGIWSFGAAPGSESLRVTPVTSAVNYISVFGAIAGQTPTISPQGSDTNIPLGLSSKGGSAVTFYTNAFGNVQFNISNTASSVNYIQVTGGISGATPRFFSSTSGIPVSIAGSHTWAGFSNASAAIGVDTDITSSIGSHVVIGAVNGNSPYIGASNYSTSSNAGLRVMTAGTTQFHVTNTASSVNYFQVTGQASGGGPALTAAGSDTNISTNFITKGTGNHVFYTNGSAPQLVIAHTASAVNYLQVTGGVAGGVPFMQTAGTDTNIPMSIIPKGTGYLNIQTGGGTQFLVIDTASAVNYLRVQGGATGGAPVLAAIGSDTNIGIALTPKGTGSVDVGGVASIVANSSSAALRITQVGSGNALLVEDSANPDATPFVVDANGNVGIGTTTPTAPLHIFGAVFPLTRIERSTAVTNGMRSTVSAIHTTSGDMVDGFGADISFGIRDSAGVDNEIANFGAVRDGEDNSGAFELYTKTSGTSTLKMKIDKAGRVGIGLTAPSTSPGVTLLVNKTITGGVVGAGVTVSATIASDVTTIGRGFSTDIAIENATFTIPDLQHFVAIQGTKGAAATITNQYGFNASSTLIGATNNYGFYSNIASGTGRWNFYAAGTADNYFAGRVGIGGAATTGEIVAIRNTAETTATIFGLRNLVNVNQATTTTAYGIVDQTQLLSPAALTNITRFYAAQGSFTGTATNQYGFFAQSTLTGATNNYGFYSNIASGTGRWNFYAAGTAANVFAGTTSIGGIVGAESLRVTPVASAVNYYNMQGSITGNTPQLAVQGSDTNIQFAVSSKGSGQVRFFTNAFGQEQFAITHTASAVNYLQATGSATGANLSFSAQGSDTNINIAITPKGTGKIIPGGAITSRINTIATGASVTIAGDTTDLAIHINTEVAGTLTINAPTGTPFDGQKIMIRLVSTNVQTFSWNAIFAGSNDIPLPTVSTGSGKYDYIGFIYNSAATKWQILAKNFGF